MLRASLPFRQRTPIESYGAQEANKPRSTKIAARKQAGCCSAGGIEFLALRLAGDAVALYSLGASRRAVALGTRVEEGDGDRKSVSGGRGEGEGGGCRVPPRGACVWAREDGAGSSSAMAVDLRWRVRRGGVRMLARSRMVAPAASWAPQTFIRGRRPISGGEANP